MSECRPSVGANLQVRIPQVNDYLAHKQHLLPGSRGDDVVQVTRDMVALHATAATGPYFSLWSRVSGFQRQALEAALYEQHSLVKWLCMRVTLHVAVSDEVAFFYRAFPVDFFERPMPIEFRGGGLLSYAGLCSGEEAPALLADLHRRVLAVVADEGPMTTQQIGQKVPEFAAKIHHDVGKAYEGEFSIGSRLVGDMCMRGLLVRTRPRGSWRSSLYEYAALSDWLPDVDLESVTQDEARVWLLRRYLSAFGPATLDDVQWWTGLTKGETEEAFGGIASEVAQVTIDGLDDAHLMLAKDAEGLRDFTPPDDPYVFLLPSLDPYIMGYRDRCRFLAAEHRKKVFDRAGNAVPTVWVDGRVVGVWGQHKDGRIFHELFESMGDAERGLLADEVQRLEGFLEGEALPPGIRTPFTRALE
ncbi:MAG: winged helix DNA-binding domain-containing protein [Anaerolineae bacterium]